MKARMNHTQDSWKTTFRRLRGELSAAEQRAGDYFELHPESAYQSITEVVEQSGISYGTVIRFCCKLGCRGFQDFKVMLAMDHARSTKERESPEAQGIAQQLQDELQETIRLLDRKVLDQATGLLRSRRTILVCGVASSAPLVLSLAWKLKRVGFDAFYSIEGYVMSVDAFRLGKKDLLIAISSSGATKDVLRAAEVASKAGAKVLAITNFSSSPLSRLADYSLFTSASRDPLKAETPSIISGEAVSEMLLDRLLALEPERRNFLLESFKVISDRKL